MNSDGEKFPGTVRELIELAFDLKFEVKHLRERNDVLFEENRRLVNDKMELTRRLMVLDKSKGTPR